MQTNVIVPIAAAEEAVSAWRSAYDPSAPQGMPAHVTLMFPFLGPRHIGEQTLDSLGALFSAEDPFDVAFRRFGTFPGVLYLAPEPSAPFSRLTARIARHFGTLPYEGRHSEVIPHLTVAMDTDDELNQKIEEAVSEHLPIVTRVEEAWLMVLEEDRWRKTAAFSFAP
ncbi:MAG TPA: 2'-5' RNA ligase family protein [Actinomycetota bacterium]|jgi:2'-5' RNA ligase|nr:2'-5' RNA ligase family protein [Actinomycetota bacterium]